MPKQSKTPTAPLVPGGLYRKRHPVTGRYLYATISDAEEQHDGVLEGSLNMYGRKPVRVREGMERFSGWELIARPALLDEPVGPGPQATEDEDLKARIAALEADKARLLNASVVERIKVLLEEDKSWAAIGRALDIPWQTAKSLYEKAED